MKLLTLKIPPETIVQLKSGLESSHPFVTAFDYFGDKEKFQQIKFNVESLDTLTGGGIDIGSVTEIFGEAGSGKTQICMQLALNCVLPKENGGLAGRTIHISTDKQFAIQRLYQMASSLRERVNLPDLELLDNIDIMEFSSKEELRVFVSVSLPQRLEQFANIRLVIIDSIAGIFRHETNYIARADEMRGVVQKLERLADDHNFAIIMTNHVTSGIDDSCLGTAFENLVSTKLKIKNTEEYRTSKSGISRVRLLDVIFSPRLPCRRERFLISSSGIVEAPAQLMHE